MSHVSRETEPLAVYRALLLKWQASINLIAPNTVKDVGARHFADSQEVAALVTGQTLLDLGSGGGFPGLVIAICRPDLAVTLVEADARKCAFLKLVSRETQTPVKVVNQRIETFTLDRFDTITARALAPLPTLLGYAAPFFTVNPQLEFLSFKGSNWRDEVSSAKRHFDFCYAPIKRDSSDGIVLNITKLTRR